jgi:hypothetical protein
MTLKPVIYATTPWGELPFFNFGIQLHYPISKPFFAPFVHDFPMSEFISE